MKKSAQQRNPMNLVDCFRIPQGFDRFQRDKTTHLQQWRCCHRNCNLHSRQWFVNAYRLQSSTCCSYGSTTGSTQMTTRHAAVRTINAMMNFLDAACDAWCFHQVHHQLLYRHFESFPSETYTWCLLFYNAICRMASTITYKTVKFFMLLLAIFYKQVLSPLK